MSKSRLKPPPFMEGFRITHYVVRDRTIKFRGPTNHFVNGNELGSVPRLAIGENRSGKFALFHCGRTWNVRGSAAFFDRLSDVKRSAERVYPGISKRWVRTGISWRQADAYRKRIWKG